MTQPPTKVHSSSSAIAMMIMLAMAAPIHVAAQSNRADPCALVTASDAQAAVGVPMGQPEALDDNLYRHCTYVSADKRFEIEVSTIADDEASFERGRRLPGAKSNTVQGLGANAYSDPDRNTLLIYKKEILLNIQIVDHTGKTSAAQLEADEKKAAAAAIPRL